MKPFFTGFQFSLLNLYYKIVIICTWKLSLFYVQQSFFIFFNSTTWQPVYSNFLLAILLLE